MFHRNDAAGFHAHLSKALIAGSRKVNLTAGNARAGNPVLPVPNWDVASTQWGKAWQLHVYGFAFLFLTVSLVCTGIVFKFFQRIRRSKIVLNTTCLLCLSGLFRILYLTVDPYGYSDRFSGVIIGVLSQIIYPLMCASFGLIQIMLLRITRVDVGKSKLRSCTYLLASTLSYLFCIVLAEVIVFYETKAKLLLLIDSGFFIILSLYLCISFICNGFRLSQYASETKRVRKELGNFSTTRREQPGVKNSKSTNSLRLSRPKLRITDENHMTIAIATDIDSSSSSDGNGRKKESRRGIKSVIKTNNIRSPERDGSDHSETEVLISEEEILPGDSTQSASGLTITHPLQTFADFQSLSENEEIRKPMISEQTTRAHASESESDDASKLTKPHTPRGPTGTLENGYMADTEIVLYSPKTRRTRTANPYPVARQHVPIQEEFDSTDLERNSSTLSVNFRTKPTSISLLRIRQSKMIQRAVQLTYCITFLFLFACLLQLYTVFGVYGVLNSSFVPDPWPWYTFQTLFRFTEVAIGLTSSGVVYIIISHRAARGRRKLHVSRDLISDCVV